MVRETAMEFRINCECGKRIFVTTGSAGGTVRCECGRTVTVPLLSELRRQAGLPAYQMNPAEVIEQMLAAGELPPVQPCARCSNPTDEVLNAVAECESSWAGQSARPGDSAIGYIVVAAVPIPVALVDVEEGEAKGGELTVPIPVRMCRGCQRRLLQAWLVPAFRTAEIAALAVGWVLLFTWSPWAALFLPVAGGLWLAERLARRRRQVAIKAVLSKVAVYGDLVDRYRDAEVFRADAPDNPRWASTPPRLPAPID
jgi:hypothetical protein